MSDPSFRFFLDWNDLQYSFSGKIDGTKTHKGIMKNNPDHRQSVSTYHLQQHELVSFLYDRFTLGMAFTLLVSLVASSLAAFELSLQGREVGVYLWFGGMIFIQYLRYLLKQAYVRIKHEDYLSHRKWKNRFIPGVYVIAFWQGLGALLLMPYVSPNLQYMIHTFLLGLGAGAIAYLATSMLVYAGYLALMILPITCYLFWQATPDGIVLGFMHLFMMTAYFFGVQRMNSMITESLHFRFDNEMLVNDLQRLLHAVAQSNKELDKIATTDELTGASNFRAFRVRLEEQRRQHIASKLPLAVIMVNVDYYNEYNMLYGQDIGNRTLTTIAHLMMGEIVQNEEVVARMNGAEFGILLPGISCEAARMMMEKVMQRLKEQNLTHEKSKISSVVTLSIGICCAPMSEEITSRDLILRADSALRQAKKNGRNRIEIANM